MGLSRITSYIVSYARGFHDGELRALNARFIHNFITNDVARHDAILHLDFICISPAGARVNRADYLTALLRSTNRSVRLKDGIETVGMTMYTDTYVREDGAWKCIQAQITPVQPAHYPPDETIAKKYVKGVAEA